MVKIRLGYKKLTASVLLIFGGGLLAWLVQTGTGRTDIRDIRFEADSGATLSALLYVPDNASDMTPAPGVLAVHGYINSRETQSAYAIELARRGYVVLALDQRGHGYSDPPAFAEGFGGPAALQYLRSLEFVDTEQIVLTGHSMGGWTVLAAAAAAPDAYQSVVVSGSSTGTFGVPEGTQEFPRNFGLVYGEYDEFSASMWLSQTGAGIVDTDKLKSVFGTAETVAANQLYGSIADGTGRMLYQPAQTHPANHITQSGVEGVLDWVQRTTTAPVPLASEAQVWPWKELGTFLSLVGSFLFLFAFGQLLLDQPLFLNIRRSPASAAGIGGRSWWLAAAIAAALPALTYFPLQGLAARLGTSALLSQNLTNGFMVWALGNALISVVLLSLWYFALGGKTRMASGGGSHSFGLRWEDDSGKRFGLAALLAVTVVLGLYIVLAINHLLFTADFRFWVVAVKLMSSLQFRIFLGYVVPFTVFFMIAGVVLHGQLRHRGSVSLPRAMLTNAVVMGLGIALLLLYQYVPLLMGGTLAIPAQSLLTIVALQFAVLLPLAGLISTWYFHRTGTVYAGGLINGLFITWVIVAGQATHFSFG
ncbi:MAG: alpha/beta fold hydrolase [Pseudohongiellaceae bacterium]